jgi:hypothetical protein
MGRVAALLLWRQVLYLNVMDYLVGPLMNLGLCPDFGPYPSPRIYCSILLVEIGYWLGLIGRSAILKKKVLF